MSNNTRSSACEYTRPGACIRDYTPPVHCLPQETNVQVAFQVLYAHTSVSDATNARVNKPTEKNTLRAIQMLERMSIPNRPLQRTIFHIIYLTK